MDQSQITREIRRIFDRIRSQQERWGSLMDSDIREAEQEILDLIERSRR